MNEVQATATVRHVHMCQAVDVAPPSPLLGPQVEPIQLQISTTPLPAHLPVQ